jgi:hypothetical protein
VSPSSPRSPANPPAPSGYSGTPLAKKLGLKPDAVLVARHAPPEYARWLAPLPDGARVVAQAPASPAAVHLFVTRRAALAVELQEWRRRLAPDGFLWVSWPKKASGVATDLTEDGIRELALPLGFVDVKVCAVTDVWSGLKLVVRKALRR